MDAHSLLCHPSLHRDIDLTSSISWLSISPLPSPSNRLKASSICARQRVWWVGGAMKENNTMILNLATNLELRNEVDGRKGGRGQRGWWRGGCCEIFKAPAPLPALLTDRKSTCQPSAHTHEHHARKAFDAAISSTQDPAIRSPAHVRVLPGNPILVVLDVDAEGSRLLCLRPKGD